MSYLAQPCKCSWPNCKDWHVSAVAAMQGVCFTKEQAEAVAELLNLMEEEQRWNSSEQFCKDR